MAFRLESLKVVHGHKATPSMAMQIKYSETSLVVIIPSKVKTWTPSEFSP